MVTVAQLRCKGFVAPGVFAAVAAARRLLPLHLGRQTHVGPFAKRLRVGPAHQHNRVRRFAGWIFAPFAIPVVGRGPVGGHVGHRIGRVGIEEALVLGVGHRVAADPELIRLRRPAIWPVLERSCRHVDDGHTRLRMDAVGRLARRDDRLCFGQYDRLGRGRRQGRGRRHLDRSARAHRLFRLGQRRDGRGGHGGRPAVRQPFQHPRQIFIVIGEGDGLVGRPGDGRLGIGHVERHNLHAQPALQIDGQIHLVAHPGRLHGLGGNENDEDAADVQAAADRFHPLLTRQDALRRDPYRPPGGLEGVGQAVGQLGVFLGVADEDAACQAGRGNAGHGWRGGSLREQGEKLLRPHLAQSDDQMLALVATVGEGDEQPRFTADRHSRRKLLRRGRKVIETEVLQLIIAEGFDKESAQLIVWNVHCGTAGCYCYDSRTVVATQWFYSRMGLVDSCPAPDANNPALRRDVL